MGKGKSLLPPNSTFPEPPFHRVEDRGGKLNCIKFFSYWASLTKPLGDRIELCQVKIYRHWPVISVKLVEPERKDTYIEMMTGACPLEPENYVQWFLDRFGSGRWHVVMNEDHVHGEIMEAYFSAIDLDRYPPKLDLRTVVVGEKSNETYLRWLAATGVKTPWANPQGQEDDDMSSAAGEALKVVATAVTDMAQKNVELAEAAADARVEAAEAKETDRRENPEEARIPVSAAIEGMKMVSNAADQTIKMVTSHAGSQFNPIEMMKAAAEIVRPQKNDDPTLGLVLNALTSANERALAMQKEQLDFYKAMVMKPNGDGSFSLAPQQVQPPQPVGGLRSMLEEGKELVELAEMLGFKRAGRGAAVPEAPPPEPGKSIMVTIVENIVPITTGLALVANLLYNVLRKGEPQNPQEAVQNAQRQAAAFVPPEAQPQPTGFHPQPDQPGAAQPQPAANGDPFAAWRQFITEIEGPLVSHFFGTNYNGYTFAEFILSNGSGAGENTVGRKTYDTIKEQLGPAGFDQLVQSHFPLWSKLSGTPQKYKQFLTEFFTYDEWQAEEAGKPEGGVPTASPAAA
jgi:hypothetical protein